MRNFIKKDNPFGLELTLGLVLFFYGVTFQEVWYITGMMPSSH